MWSFGWLMEQPESRLSMHSSLSVEIETMMHRREYDPAHIQTSCDPEQSNQRQRYVLGGNE